MFRERKNKKGFTLTEVLVAILIISIASAALAASVNSASNMNATGLKIDSDYRQDLNNANNQTVNGKEGEIEFAEVTDENAQVNWGETAQSTYDHAVTVFGDGDLSTATGEVDTPEGEFTGANRPGTHKDTPDMDTENYTTTESDDVSWGFITTKLFLDRGDVFRTVEHVVTVEQKQWLIFKYPNIDIDVYYRYFVVLDQNYLGLASLFDSGVELAANSEWSLAKFQYTNPQTGASMDIHKIWEITDYVDDPNYRITSSDFDNAIWENKYGDSGEKAVFEKGTMVFKDGHYYICTYTHEACLEDYSWLNPDNSKFDAWACMNMTVNGDDINKY